MIDLNHSLDEAQDWAALYALGALRGEEAAEFEAHLSLCSVCAAERLGFRAVTDRLALAADPCPPGLRDRVLRAARNEQRLRANPEMEHDGFRFVRTTDMEWQTKLPSTHVKVLSVDSERRTITRLVRMESGAALPPHRHTGPEESYILEGDLIVSGVAMHPGDYCRAQGGTVHEDVRTRGGCVFIAIAALDDQVVAPAEA